MGGQEALDGAQRLTQAVGVFDQTDTDMVITIFTKAEAGGDGNARFFQKEFRESDTPHGPERLGNGRPGEP